MDKQSCAGSNKEPRCIVINDWFIGKRAICSVCGKSTKPTKTNKVARHK